MGIDAVALLRGSEWDLPKNHHVVRLDDGVLFHTHISFVDDEDQMGFAIYTLLGDGLSKHGDERGVLLFPDVVEPRAKKYEDVIREVEGASIWVEPTPQLPDNMLSAPKDSLLGIVGDVMQKLGVEQMMALQQAMMSGDRDAMEKAQAQLEQALGGPDALDALGKQLLGAVGKEAPGILGGTADDGDTADDDDDDGEESA